MIAALTLGAFAGCTKSQNIVFDVDSAKDAAVRLNFYGYKYESLNVLAIEEALHGFMEKNTDVTIAYEGIKSPAYYEVLEKRMSTGNGDDIIMVDHERARELSARGDLLDLSDLSTLGLFSELAKSQMTAGTRIDYVPTSISAFGLYCNLSLLKKHGRSVPENLAEFEDTCEYFVSRGIVPIVANNDISLKTIAIAKGMYPVYRRDDASEELERLNLGESDYGETLRPGLELVRRMLDRGYVDAEEAANAAKTKDDLTIFAKGDRPFMLTGAWASVRVKDLNPDLDFVVSPYPIFEDGSALVINIDTRIAVNAHGAHTEEAKAFVEYFTQQDVMWKFVDSQSSFSPLKENRISDDRSIKALGPYINNGRSVLGADDNLRFPVWDMTKDCIRRMLAGESAEDAVAYLNACLDEWREGEV